MKKFKVIIDTDPGVDDTNALIYAMFSKKFDIKLFTIANGNININAATRNMCHLLDIFNKDIPVVKGYDKRLGNNTEDASFLHGKEGLGFYLPPKTTRHKPLKVDTADAVYEVLKKYPKEITMVILGPHTNFAYLLKKHPDSVNLIKNVLMMGGTVNGTQGDPNHRSFNIRTDAPAFKMTIDSKLPVVMCPSNIGKDIGYFTEAQVNEIKNFNDVGKFLYKTFGTYWEPGYEDRRIAISDLCTVCYLAHPHVYKTKRADISVDTTDSVGKTTINFNKHGQFKVIVDLNRKKIHKIVLKKFKSLSDLTISDKTFLKNIKNLDEKA